MNRADQRGYITFDDVIELLEEEEADDITSLDSILDELDALGIEIQKEGHDSSMHNLQEDYEPEYEPYEMLHDPELGDISGISSDDPVGLYFRQMAQEPLLNASEEI